MVKKQFALGAITSLIDLRDFRADVKSGVEYCFTDDMELPMPAVKNQGSVCSCVAHSLATVEEYFDHKETGSTRKMSTNYIYGNRRDSLWKGEGMRIRDALKAMMTYGDVPYTRLPGNDEVPTVIDKFEAAVDELAPTGQANRIKRYFRLDSIDSIKACIVDYGPVVFCVKWPDDTYVKDDVVHLEGNASILNDLHCMVIYGWEKRGWKIQNSWGPYWGNHGRAILPYDASIREAWGIEDAANEIGDNWLDITHPFSSELGKLIAKVLNTVLNWLLRRNK